MAFRHVLSVLFVAALPVAPHFPQSLGEAAQKEKQRREEKQRPKAGVSPPSYTEADLRPEARDGAPAGSSEATGSSADPDSPAAAAGSEGATGSPQANPLEGEPRRRLSSLSGQWSGMCQGTSVGSCPPVVLPPDGLGAGPGAETMLTMDLKVSDAGEIVFEAAGVLGPRGAGRVSSQLALEIRATAEPAECNGQRTLYQAAYSGQVVDEGKAGLSMRFQGERMPCPGSCGYQLACSLRRLPPRR